MEIGRNLCFTEQGQWSIILMVTAYLRISSKKGEKNRWCHQTCAYIPQAPLPSRESGQVTYIDFPVRFKMSKDRRV